MCSTTSETFVNIVTYEWLWVQLKIVVEIAVLVVDVTSVNICTGGVVYDNLVVFLVCNKISYRGINTRNACCKRIFSNGRRAIYIGTST